MLIKAAAAKKRYVIRLHKKKSKDYVKTELKYEI